jgi:hypothetical protein
MERIETQNHIPTNRFAPVCDQDRKLGSHLKLRQEIYKTQATAVLGGILWLQLHPQSFLHNLKGMNTLQSPWYRSSQASRNQ